jgi:hypothetical protein
MFQNEGKDLKNISEIKSCFYILNAILSTDKIRKLVFEKVPFSFVSSTFKYKMETSCNQ